MIDPYEVEKLSAVKEFISREILATTNKMFERRQDLTDAHKEILKEMTIIRNMDDVLNHTMLSSEIAQHERQYSRANARILQLKNMYDSPYFARIDFAEEGFANEVEEIYIGKASLSDGMVYYVYDWRAPISSLYYDYGVGEAAFSVEADGRVNEIRGEVRLKRQYQIRGGELVYMFDSELTIDDDILQHELSRVTDSRIKTIIHSIQKEQNLAIRSEAEQLLVFGPAGSGKTSVGLHRLAFLLYRHRGSLSSARLRVFSPSTVFASYIDGIIPDLGEEDVETLDFSHMGRGKFEQIEALQDGTRKWIAEKSSREFAEFLEGFVRGYSPDLDEDVLFDGKVICARERLAELYRDRTSAGTLKSKTARVLEYVSQAHDEYFAENRREVAAFFNRLAGETLTDGAVRFRFDEQKQIVMEDLKRRLLPAARRLYERALRKYGLRGWVDFENPAFEDALALYYIEILSGRAAKDGQVRHILLDEAQDISYLQHRVLQELYKGCRFTVLADVNQALYPEIHLQDEAELIGLYAGAEVVKLTTAYRSTVEINRFAAGVLGKDAGEGMYERHGEEPVIVETDDPVAAVAEILGKLDERRDEFNTVGILLGSARDAREFYERLNADGVQPVGVSDRLRLIADDGEGDYAPGVMVMAVPFAKGLEFDVVICPGYGGLDARCLYLVCTRALHWLYLVG